MLSRRRTQNKDEASSVSETGWERLPCIGLLFGSLRGGEFCKIDKFRIVMISMLQRAYSIVCQRLYDGLSENAPVLYAICRRFASREKGMPVQ